MIVDKIHENVSFKLSKWLEKYVIFNTPKRNKAQRNSKKISIDYLISHFMEEQWKMYEIVWD